ncbi:amino acid adenylation domain-containing protein [Gordonia sp. (in: high G+C Gram-positive bacteria)]|uniref:amino acid adenylation domain-containing protein n=1 Tax=Gordonia sp. (in: high G+C Gram-positive bacteria) TaxID=84139 RepID=UPI003C795EF6
MPSVVELATPSDPGPSETTALVFGNRRVSYREFAERVNTLARNLIAAGVGPDIAVAVAMPRSVELLVAVHAINTAGGHYVPVDMDAPAERVEYMLSISSAKLVLVAAGATPVAGLGAAQVIEVDTAIPVGTPAAPITDADRIAPLRSDDAAYTLFTSGSTGRPKGVTVSHRAIVNRLEWMRDWYRLGPDDIFLQKTPATFDVSVWELFLPLALGATLVIAEPDRHGDPTYLAEVINREQVTTIHFVPSMLAAFVDVLGDRLADLTSLRMLFTSGEALTVPVARGVLNSLGRVELHNLYGPTEAAVDVTAQHVRLNDPSVPIGIPVPETTTLILDPRLQLVPRGVPGELYLGGIQLARGYAARPDLTAERFVADPFGGPGDRLYRTGDLVRWNSAGHIEYLGRTDFQVKLRGQRLELGEVEAVLAAAPGVVHAAAAVAKLAAGDQLVAYLAPRGIDLDAAKAAVATALPEYMRPTVWMVLDSMPLNTAGKVARRQLPAPEITAARYLAPEPGVQSQLAEVYSAVLCLDEVSAAESFFDLGGNSLAATRLAARIGAALDIDVTVRDIFDHPSIRELAAALDGRGRQIVALTARERPERLPLSTAQQRMWFINQFDTASPAYNIPMGLQLRGDLDLINLVAALGDVMERHEVLRTVYPSDEQGPFQRILSPGDARAAFRFTEATDSAGLIDAASTGFDIVCELPIRAAFRSTDDGVDIVVIAHHIAFDGESTAIFVRDLLGAYLHRTGGNLPVAGDLAVQYADFALWQRDVLGLSADPSSPMAQQLAYWHQHLADLPAVTDLPMDRPRPAVLDTAAEVVNVAVDDALSAGIDSLARAHDATGFMVAHAALAITVARLAATSDVVIGSPIAGRTDAAMEDLIGMFVNTLVLRTTVDPAQSIGDFLNTVRGVDLDAFAHADVQFDDLIEQLAPERSTAYQPLAQIAFTHTSGSSRSDLGVVELPGLTAQALATAAPVAKFDLTVEVNEAAADTGMSVRFLYATALFDEDTIRRLADVWLQVVAAMVTDPGVATGDIDIVGLNPAGSGAASRNSVGGTAPAADGGVSIPTVLPDVLAKRYADPDHLALICDGVELTYREFDARTEAVARALIDRGVGPEDIVAVGLERSIDSVVAAFGIIKAGAAYVPIDPAYPRDRIDYMVDDSGVRVGITNATTRLRLGDGNVDWIEIGANGFGAVDEEAAPVRAADRNGVLTVDSLAYLVYTSGSTGRPKAVGVSHRGLANFIDQFREVSGSVVEAPDTRVLHVASPSFDASVLEMMWSIGLGHTLVIAPAAEYAGEALGRVLDRDGVTDTLITPTVLATVDPARGRRIRNLVTGGEACPPELISRWAGGDGAGTRTMYNFYGPSEATVWSLTGRSVPGQPVTIGHPVRGFTAHVLDTRLHRVPLGVVGELYLSSTDSLARGYLNRAGHTASAFVADPFSVTPGSRMYATGDLVRVNRRGEIEFAGRADYQVKINGQRVELGEIEAAFADLPTVHAAVVVGIKDRSGRSRLVAYVVPSGDAELMMSEVLDEVAQKLAAHMVPHAAVVLDELPLTPGGKLDRRALPVPDFTSEQTELVAPASSTEETLAAIVAGLLGRERISVTESFFALGGDSIMSIQLASAARAAGLSLSPREIFEHKTVRAMARAASEEAHRLPMIVEPDGAPSGEVAIAPIVQWLVESAPGTTDFADFNQAMVLTAPDGVTREQLAQVLAAVVHAHPMLSASLTMTGESAMLTAGNPFDADGAVSVTDTDDLTAGVIGAHAADATRLDPARGHMIRVSLVRAATLSRAVITIHHLSTDAVSWPILIEDLVTAWSQLAAGQPIHVRPEGSSVRAWNAAIAEHRADRRAELDYWLERSPERANPLGTAFDPVRDTYVTSESVVHTVPAAIAGPLITDVPNAFGGAVTDVLLAALARAVRTWQQSVGIDDDEPIAVLSEGHGRYEDVLADATTPTQADLSRTVGWFTTIAPILIDPTADAVHAVKSVKEERLARPGHGIGYGLLRYEGDSELARRPLPSIAFNYLGGSGSVVEAATDGGSEPEIGFLPAAGAPFLPAMISGGLAAMAPLVINASTVAGTDGPVLSADFLFAPAVLSATDVRAIADNWSRELIGIVDAARHDVGLSPADVPGSSITQADLDAIAAKHPGADVWPLTPLQSGLYFQSQLAVGDTATGADAVDVYVTQAILHLGGDIDVARLRAATNDLLSHHRALRSSFVHTPGGAVVAVVPSTVEMPWRVVDLMGTVTTDNDAEIARLATVEKLTPFDMAASPLMRLVLVRQHDRASVIITNHHILFDGWSGPLVMADLLALYATGATYTGMAGERSADFADYVRRIGSADRAAGLEAWREVLAPVTEPTLVAPSAEATADAMPRDHEIALGGELSAAIETLSRTTGATVATVLQFAWAVMISRYTGNRVVTIGETVSGRPADLAGVETMVGLFINTLPAVVDVDPQVSAANLLSALQADKVKVLDHQHLSLPELTALTGLPALFDTLTVYESYPIDTESLTAADAATGSDALAILGAEVSDATHYPLNMGAAPTADGILLTLKYLPSVFADRQVGIFAEALRQILSGICTNPDRQIGDLLLVAPEALSDAVLPPTADALAPRRLVDLLADRDLDPEHPALIAGHEVITYRDFEAQTNRVARALLARGVGPDDIVAVVIDRSIESVVAVWSIVKTGAAFVAIDPAHPDERIAGMLDDTQSRWGITVAEHLSRLAELGPHWLLADDLRQPSSADPHLDEPITDAERNGTVRLDNLAYLIFTSGTTGRPKAAANNHRGLATVADRLAQITHESRERTRILHLSSPSFDASFFEMLWALGAGHTLVIAPPTDYAGPALDNLLTEHAITDLVLTPSVLASLDIDRAPFLRNLIVCGEACPQDLVEKWAGSGKAMFNFYGPSEATIISSTAILRPGKPVTVGTSVRGFTGYVLDDRLHPVPHGFVGELYLSAKQGVGRGYLRRAGLTAERFVADPFQADGGRMYATGDLVRINDDAELEFAGRADFQVKIAGQRIELTEIEAVLADVPGVQSAVAIGVGKPASSIAAYVVADGSREVTGAEVRAALRQRLPAFMIPASLAVIDEIPLNANGKLDRLALPEPELAADEYVAPTTQIERRVAEVFADVLDVDRIGVTASFFEMGGNSLSATRLAARVSEALGVEVSVRDVFAAPAVRDLVAEVAGRGAAVEPVAAVSPRPDHIPLSFAQQRIWFINQLAPASAAYNVPAVVRLVGPLDPVALRAAVLDIVDRHEVLRTTFPSEHGVAYQQIHSARWAADLLDWAVVDTAEEIRTAVTTGFDLGTQLPIRVRLHEAQPDEHVLAIVAHHVAADGESVRPLVGDLVTAYAARTAGESPTFAPMAVQYADYALWQHRVLGDPKDPESVLGRELEYWLAHLAGLPEVLALPTDRARPPVATHAGAEVTFEIPAAVVEAVGAVAARTASTPFMVVHAVLATVLSRLSGSADIAIATPIAGRGQRDLDPLVGMFVNTLVLRTVIEPAETFVGLLDKVRSADVEAFAHAALPFEVLVDALNPTRSEAFSPLAQVMLAFSDGQAAKSSEAPASERGLAHSMGGDLSIAPAEIADRPAQFDLTVNLAGFVPAASPAATAGARGGWQGSLIYATDLFDAATAQRFADYFASALASAVGSPEQFCSGLELIADRSGLPSATPPLTETVNAGRSLVDLLADSIAAHGGNSAVSDGTRTLTYTELDQRSSEIAAGLVQSGVLPRDLVAVATGRNVELIAAIIGVLKAGAGYLPLDTTNPEERLRFIVGDASPTVVIVDGSTSGLDLWSSLPAEVAVHTVAELGQRGVDASPVSVRIHPDDRAYVIYTSGSTGRPKGVEVTHRDAVTLMDSAAEVFDFDARDVWTMFHSYAFDFSVWELLGPLCSGARLVVVDRETVRDPVRFLDLCATEGVTVLSQTPSAFYQFAQARRERGGAPLALRYVIFGGEQLNFEYVRRWFDDFAADPATLVNMYGITETTVHVTFRELTRESVSANDASFIGSPLSSLGLHILDSYLRPVPEGVVGEMYVTGGQLARGYLNRPGLSADRFVANPFGPAGSRMYRTGDVARRVGGDIAYLGRSDTQVQLRGYRIEYGEIEAAMLAAAEVVSAAAHVVAMADRGDQLVGYVVLGDGAVLDAAAVRAIVGRAVPSYMVPDVVVAVDELPLTANGKLDRKALPVPDGAVDITVEYVEPATSVEAAIAAVFAEVLGVPRVSATASFFDVGGNSLSATRVRAQLSEHNGLEIELAWLFSDPTPRALADRIARGNEAANDVVITLRGDGTRTPLFCIHPAGGLAWFYGGLIPYLPDRPIYGLQDPHVVAGEPAYTEVAQIAARYVAEIRSVQPEGPYQLLGWSIGGVIAYAIANQFRREGHRVSYLGVMDAQPDTADSLAAATAMALPDAGEAIDSRDVMDVLGGWRALFDFGDDVTAETPEELTDIIASQISGMGLFGAEQVARIMDNFATAADVALTLQPEPFDGSIQVFVATDDKTEPEVMAQAWRRYVASVDPHYVQTHHLGMTDADSLAVIGPLVDEALVRSGLPTSGDGN